jgi:hypothetical protein
MPVRQALAQSTTLPDIQFDIANFLAAPMSVDDGAGPVLEQLAGPVFTTHALYELTRTPTMTDQQVLSDALATIEQAYPYSTAGVFMSISYGVPYFNRLRSGLVRSSLPRLLSNRSQSVLQEAVPGPTDVSPVNPGITKLHFNVPVTIEHNDVQLQLRSDSSSNITDILAWLAGSNTLAGTSTPSPAFNGLLLQTGTRVMFQQVGLPRKVADANNLSFASEVNPDSEMWMSFSDQQLAGSAPAAQTVTFVGTSSARLTTAQPGDYFDNGAIQHLSHIIEDLPQFYSTTADPTIDPFGPEPFTERCQYMFRSDPIPSVGNTDQFTNGGGPAYINNTFQGTGDARLNATGVDNFEPGDMRLGHLQCLQRSSRATDGTPLHIRNDGAGFDSLDVPDGSNQPKLHFTIFVPTSQFFQTLRVNMASLDLQNEFNISPGDNGLERFLTATRRQNFLVPPRRHRAFPLVEFD